jgi:ABC-2 type transport system permease protein
VSAVARALWNPIVAKEYLSRMRTWRSSVAMMVYILLLGGLGWAIFAAMTSASVGAFGSSGAANYGQALFTYLLIFQMLLLAFITPALTAGAISGERERQTIDLLFVTLIPPFAIIWGKLLASMSFVLVLLMLSVPIFSLVFLFGGIEFDQVGYAFLVTGVTALTLGMLGVACSTIFRRTLPATVAAYGAGFLLMAGTLVYGLLFPTEIDPKVTTPAAPPAITFISPVIPLLTIATGQQSFNGYGVRFPNSLNGMPPGCYQAGPNGVACSGPIGISGPIVGSKFGGTPTIATGTMIPSGLFHGWQYWQASVAMQLLICLLALGLSAFLLPPIRRLPWRRRAEPSPDPDPDPVPAPAS